MTVMKVVMKSGGGLIWKKKRIVKKWQNHPRPQRVKNITFKSWASVFCRSMCMVLWCMPCNQRILSAGWLRHFCCTVRNITVALQPPSPGTTFGAMTNILPNCPTEKGWEMVSAYQAKVCCFIHPDALQIRQWRNSYLPHKRFLIILSL